jgi:hypothetical protein
VDRAAEGKNQDWKKSKASGTSNCVEVKVQERAVKVRNSRMRESELSFTKVEWHAFVEGVKAGEFDLFVQQKLPRN